MQKFRLSSILLTQVILNYSQKKDDTSRVDDVYRSQEEGITFFLFFLFLSQSIQRKITLWAGNDRATLSRYSVVHNSGMNRRNSWTVGI